MRTSMVLSTSTRNSVDAESHLICYRFNSSTQSLNLEDTLQSLARVDFGVSPSAILAGTDWVIVLADAQGGIEASKKLICEPSMEKIATIRWYDVLQFLHLANSPKEQCCKEGILGFFKTFLNQKRPSDHLDAAEASSSPILEIRSGNEGVRKSSLAAKMLSFMKADPGNIQGLEHYVKGLRIGLEQFQDIQLPKDTAKVNTITGLARPDDSRNSQKPFPARVQRYGCGSKDVEFCYKPRGQRKGQYITVFDYFTKIKHKTVHLDDLPVVNIGTRSKPAYIPPSCCDVIERGEPEASVLSTSDLMHMVSSGITNEANMPRWLSNGIVNDETRSSGLKLPLAENLKNCQITMICATLINPCRIETAPAIVYSGHEKFSPRAGTWTIDQTGLTSNNNNNNSNARCKIAVMLFGSSRWVADEKITDTLQSLHNQLGPFSIGLVNTSSPLKVALRDNKISPELEYEIKSHVSDMAKDNVAAVVFMLPSRSKPIYEYIKRLCDLDLGIHSVCIDAHKLAAADNDRGYCFQTALKLNMKMGGQNQRLDPQPLLSISLRSTMIVGIDVMMPTPIANKRPKPVVLMVSSIDPDLSQWPAMVQVARNKDSIAQAVKHLLSTRIELWKKKNTTSPENVIVYHKGLTENMGTDEAASIRKATGNQANVTLIAVNKDHHTKLQVPSSNGRVERFSLVHGDAIITRSHNGAKSWEFLVQGHQPQHTGDKAPSPSAMDASKATLPTRCAVLHDDIFTNPNAKRELEDLTHDMQYLFGCSTAATSDTLPIHYVGLLRKRVALYLQPWHGPQIEGRKRSHDETNLPGEEMSMDAVKIHEKLSDGMFYI
ncbi:MAG: hypothetical protein Q9205_002875 [Flavoplaca limonia]